MHIQYASNVTVTYSFFIYCGKLMENFIHHFFQLVILFFSVILNEFKMYYLVFLIEPKGSDPIISSTFIANTTLYFLKKTCVIQ